MFSKPSTDWTQWNNENYKFSLKGKESQNNRQSQQFVNDENCDVSAESFIESDARGVPIDISS